MEHIIIGHNFIITNRRSKMINLKREMRGVCSCKTRFLRFSDEGKSPKTELVRYMYGGLYFFGGIIDMWMYVYSSEPRYSMSGRKS